MLRSLWIKFLVLLLGVSAVGLTSAFFLRELMINDFQQYLEGEQEDRVYWVTADIEGSYEKQGEWNREVVAEDAIRALMLGLDIRVIDINGSVVMDTDGAVAALSPLVKQRMTAMLDSRSGGASSGFTQYPLFLGGREIGSLEVRFLRPERGGIFIERSNRFLFFSLLGLGGLAAMLSLALSRRLTRPVQRLSTAAEAIGEGNYKSRVPVSGRDELGSLSVAFNRMAKALETQDALRKKLIANVAHELRTPLSSMRAEIEGMADGVIHVDADRLKSLRQEIERLAGILTGIDDLTQAQASSLTLGKRPVELRPFLENITVRFSALSKEKGGPVGLRCDESVFINADPERLSQIIVNLLNNSIKATAQGGRVWLAVDASDMETRIEVGDSGAGIRQEDIPFVFERFYRASEGGLGLGLAIVKELVDAHEWRIEAKSGFGKGSSFTIIVPRAGIHNSS